jgi:large subunit ribosomal protein L17e
MPQLPLPPKAAFSLRKMELKKAKKYLEDVLGHKRAIPFRRYSGNVGRTGQAKNEGAPAGQARWPAKSCEFLLNLLKNAESNAEVRHTQQHTLLNATHTCMQAHHPISSTICKRARRRM